MKRNFLCLGGLFLSFLGFCQESSLANNATKSCTNSTYAIKWVEGLTWQQVKARAKKENKYIFVDCYATWCKPCKEMDSKVYTIDTVGRFLNAGFIAVKLQMDQTKNDDAAVKSWYKTARSFAKEYNVTAYPTMLFFTPSGELAIKEVGYRDAHEFITMATDSKDPSKQFYVLLKQYKEEKLDDAAKRSLIMTAKQLNDTITYRTLRDSYLADLHALPKEKLYTKENIEFIASVINNRNQLVFDMFYPDGSAVDNTMKKEGYARKVVDEVIMKEKFTPVANAAAETKVEPDWNALHNSIAKDYPVAYADRNLLEAKIKWYARTGNLLEFARALNDKAQKFGASMGDDFKLNNAASSLFENLNDTAELKQIIGWMAGVVSRCEKATGPYIQRPPLYIDTYANLLYKAGETPEALKWQELAVKKARDLDIEKDFLYAIEKNFEKMKKGEPTW